MHLVFLFLVQGLRRGDEMCRAPKTDMIGHCFRAKKHQTWSSPVPSPAATILLAHSLGFRRPFLFAYTLLAHFAHVK